MAIDRGTLRWLGPLRSTLVATALVLVSLQVADSATAVTVGIGAVFVGMADLRGGFADRMRGMVLTTLLLTLAAGLGLLVSESFPLHLIMAGLVAGLCGYIGLAGPRAAFAGVLGLVGFTIFAGTPVPLQAVMPAVLMILIGGAAQILFAALPHLFRRLGGLRTDISVAYRTVAFALRGREGGITSPNAIAKLLAARKLIDSSGVEGETERWCRSLVDACDRVRVAFLALQGSRQLDRAFDEEELGRLAEATADLLMGVSVTLEMPVRRRSLEARRIRFESVMAASRPALGGEASAFLDEIEAGCEMAVREVSGPWPIGRRAEIHSRAIPDTEWLGRLWHRQDPGQLFTRHAIRLSLLIMLATAIAEVENVDHSYWLPMTVAWVTRPDLAGTAERVVSRIAGTLVGLLATALLVLAVGSSEPVMLVTFAVTLLLAIAWLQANYSICIAVWTVSLLALLSLDFPEVTELIGPRMWETVAGGLLVLLAAWVWPTRLTDQLARKLSDLSSAIASFAQALIDGDRPEIENRRNEVMLRRYEAGNLVNAAEHEPGTFLPRYEQASVILENLTGAATVALASHEAEAVPSRESDSAGQVTPRSVERLGDLAARLDSIADDRSPEPPRHPAPDSATEFESRVETALAALDHSTPENPGTGTR